MVGRLTELEPLAGVCYETHVRFRTLGPAATQVTYPLLQRREPRVAVFIPHPAHTAGPHPVVKAALQLTSHHRALQVRLRGGGLRQWWR